MRAMILAAGRGERMRPLTDTCPKPLLQVGDEALLVRLIRQLVEAKITQIVINHAWLGEQIEAAVGDGSRWQAQVSYSPETDALETAGGIVRALDQLGEAPFLVVNGDLFTDFDFSVAHRWQLQIESTEVQAVCALVPNPPHHPLGDFALHNGLLDNAPRNRLTYAGITAFEPALFRGFTPGQPAPLAPLLRQLADNGRIAGTVHPGHWSDVGTPARLAELNQTGTS